MVKKLLFVVLFCLPFFCKAQISITATVPNTGVIQRDQLWNVSVMNNTGAVLEAILSLRFKESTSGQTLFTGTATRIIFNPGLKVLTFQDIMPVQYVDQVSMSAGNYLPVGNYSICFQLNKASEGQELLANECINLQVLPLSPPQLSFPADTMTLQTIYPQFSWIPPSVIEMFTDLTYTLKVVEVTDGQTAVDAIQNNLPVYQSQNINAPFETYPSTTPKLQNGKKYAWQVSAVSSNQYSISTDVWTFKINGSDSTEVPPDHEPYIVVKNSHEPAGIVYTTRDMKLKYYSFDKEFTTTIEIMNSNGTFLKSVQQKILYGDNFINIKLGAAFHLNETYKARFVDPNQIQHTVSFIIK